MLRAKTRTVNSQNLVANKPVESDLLDIRLTVEVGNAATIELNVPGGTVPLEWDHRSWQRSRPALWQDRYTRTPRWSAPLLLPSSGIAHRDITAIPASSSATSMPGL